MNQLNWMVEHYKAGILNKTKAKILWDARSIHKKDWLLLKKFFKEYNINTVLEYGTGLSTELMVLEGLDVTSLETLDWWAEICKGAIGNEIILYREGQLPDVKQDFDMVFVDGPQAKRNKEIEQAKTLTDIIFLHDLRPAEVKLLDNWNIIEKYGKQFYKK